MNYEKALSLYKNDKTLELLREEHFPLLVSFFHLVFKQKVRISYQKYLIIEFISLKTFCLILLCLLNLVGLVDAQQLVSVTDETLVVNSVYSLNGYNRNIAEVILPEKTKSYIYRISVQAKGSPGINTSLLNLLNALGGSTVALTTSFANLAVKNNDNLAVDAYIFNNAADAENFYAKIDDWGTCKSLTSRTNFCFLMEDCLSRKIYFGFRNNNISQGLEVRLEIVALVDNNLKTPYRYSYNIRNDTGQEIKFSVSMDGRNWEAVTLRSQYKLSPTVDQREIYFRISTGTGRYINYKVFANERYKIYWNQIKGVFDLANY